MNSFSQQFDTDVLLKEFVQRQEKILIGQRFFLATQNTVFLLKKGCLDLFALTYDEKEAVQLKTLWDANVNRISLCPPENFPGTLRFLNSFREGDWLFPFSFNLSNPPICILAIAEEESQVDVLSLISLRQALPRSVELQALAMNQIQRWTRKITLVDTDLTRPNVPATLIPGQPHSFETDTFFVHARFEEKGKEQELCWLQVQKGSVCAWGVPHLTIHDATLYYPVTSEEWFKCQSGSIVELFPSHSDLLLNEFAWQGFFLFQRHFLSLMANVFENQQQTQRKDTKLRIQRDHHLLGQSIQELQSLLNPQLKIPPIPKEDLLFHACQIVGNPLELKFQWSKRGLGNTEEHLQNLCINSRIFYRRMRLLGTWWEKHFFPVLAFKGSEELPVALIPTSSGNYQIIDPMDLSKTPLTEENAGQLLPVGYLFYRQLKEPRLTFRQIWNFVIGQRRREWATLLFLMLCGTVASLIFPFLTRLLFDNVIPNRNDTLLIEIALGSIVVAVTTLAFNYGREVMILRLESLSDHDLEMAIWQRLIQMPMRFFRRHSLYDLMTYTSAVSSIRQQMVSHSVGVIFNAFFSIIYLIMMFYFNWLLAIVGVGILAVAILAMVIPAFFGIHYGRQLLERQIQANNKMLEMVEALSKVRLAGAEARLFHRWEHAFARMVKIDLKRLFLQLKAGTFNLFWSNAGTWIIYLFVILLLFSQKAGSPVLINLSLGNFLAFVSVFGLLSNALIQMSGTLLNVIGVIPLWEKVKAVAESEIEETAVRSDPGTLQGGLQIDRLTFGYQKEVPPIIQDISLTIHPGESIALVGPSGGGKTTLLKLILGFEQSDQGSVYYDNKDIKGLNLQALRRQLGVVFQTGDIFDGSIIDNINSGRHYSEEEVKTALHLIGADSLIQELAMGVRTVLTNGGLSLSGGQRQMILLARAVVGRPKILILDEATSSLDNHKQRIVYENLNRLSMTQIIVAQRLNVIQHVNRIYVIDKGKIIDTGTYSELANRPGLFADLLMKKE